MHTLKTEIAKLNKSQRKALRRICSTPLDALKVDRHGYQTTVVAESIGFHHVVTIGVRGLILSRQVWEIV